MSGHCEQLKIDEDLLMRWGAEDRTMSERQAFALALGIRLVPDSFRAQRVPGEYSLPRHDEIKNLAGEKTNI